MTFKTKIVFKIVFSLALLLGAGLELSNAQSNPWSYGLKGLYNVSFIKPIANDTFSNRSGFGAAVYAEKHFDRWSVGLSPQFTQIRFIDDRTTFVTVNNSVDLGIDMLYHLAAETKTSIHFGLLPSFLISETEQGIDGSQAGGVGGSSTKPDHDFDLGFRFGFTFRTNEWMSLELSYIEQLNGSHTKSSIKGKGDYIQLGLKLDLNSKPAVGTAKYEEARNQALLMKQSGLVFVLQTQEDPDERSVIKVQNFVQAVYNEFNFCEFHIIPASELSNYEKGDGLSFEQDFEMKTPAAHLNNYFTAHLGNNLSEEVRSENWGLYVFDQNGGMTPDPFPSFKAHGDGVQSAPNYTALIRSLNEDLHRLANPSTND